MCSIANYSPISPSPVLGGPPEDPQPLPQFHRGDPHPRLHSVRADFSPVLPLLPQHDLPLDLYFHPLIPYLGEVFLIGSEIRYFIFHAFVPNYVTNSNIRLFSN